MDQGKDIAKGDIYNLSVDSSLIQFRVFAEAYIYSRSKKAYRDINFITFRVAPSIEILF